MRAHDTRHASERGQNDTLAGLHLPGCVVSRSGLELPKTLTEDQWLEIGRALTGIHSTTSWWIGDWWTSGEHRYGDRSATVESDAWDGPGLQVCKDVAWVARAFQTSRRRDLLTFSHHREVAGLLPDQADALLDWAEEPIATEGRPHSVRALRQEKARRTMRYAPPIQWPSAAPIHAVAQVQTVEPKPFVVRAVLASNPCSVIASAVEVTTGPIPALSTAFVSRAPGHAMGAQRAHLMETLRALAGIDPHAAKYVVIETERDACIELALRARGQLDILIQALHG